MPSSDPITIPKVLKLVEILQPKSILDVGAGNGRYGFLFREILDWNYGRMKETEYQVVIDGVEVERSYLTEIHGHCYNNVFVCNWIDCEPTKTYDLIFMGDVLEHFPDQVWQKALMKARRFSKATIVVSPNWTGSSGQGAWCGNQYEAHRVELSPSKVGGRCVFASSKTFISVFGEGILGHRDILL